MKKSYSLDGLIEMCGDDQAFIEEMQKVFVENNEKYLDAMVDACNKQDWPEVKSNAHKIKPSILLMRINSLKDIILDLNEFAGKEINLDRIPSMVDTVKDGLNVVFKEMKKNS